MCSPREPREGIHGRPRACCLACRMSLPANCLRHSETPSGVSHGRGGYARLHVVSCPAPRQHPLGRHVPAACGRPCQAASPRVETPLGKNCPSILRTLCSLDAQAQGRHAAPRAAPFHGSPCAGTRSSPRLPLPRPAADGCQTRCCMTRLSPLQTARGLTDKAEPGPSGAVIGRDEVARAGLRQVSGCQPRPEPISSLRDRNPGNVVVNTLACPASESAESALRRPALPSHRIKMGYGSFQPCACHVFPRRV
jgi:hypothetical protein